MLTLPFLLGICPRSPWSPPLPRPLILVSRPPHDLVLWTDGSVPFGKGGSGVLANCSLCGTEAILSFSACPVCSSFSAEACAILHALGSTNKSAIFLLFSYYVSDSRSVLSSIFSLISNSVADLAGTVFSLLFYQATMGPRTLVSFGNDAADELARRKAILAPSATPCSLSSFLGLSYLNSLTHRFPQFPSRTCAPSSCSLCFLSSMLQRTQPSIKFSSLQDRESFLQHLRTLVPGHLSSHSALCSYGLFAPLTLCLSTTSIPDSGELPGFWGSMVFHYAPIPRKGSGNQ